jgi:undecaprenyl-diphosphatase
MSRIAATEFSFFLAIPTLLAATGLELWEARHDLSTAGLGPLALSSAVSFVAALLSIRFLLRFVSRHSFAGFAWYRIIFGGLILIAWAIGWVHFDVQSK